MGTWYAKTGITNIDDANMWSANADGSGAAASWASGAVGTSGDTLNLNGKAITLNQSTANIIIDTTTGSLTVTSTKTITGNVTYSGTDTANGCIRVETSGNLTIDGTATNSSSGRCIKTTSTGIVHITGNLVLSGSSAGIAMFVTGTGAVTIDGALQYNNTCTGYVLNCSATATVTVGSIGGNTTGVNGLSAVYFAGGTLNVIGGISSKLGNLAIWIASGIVNWTGAQTLASNADCQIAVFSGMLNLATASAALTLTNSGRFLIKKYGGTITTTAAGGTAAINNQSSAAIALGGAFDLSPIIHYPTIPAAADVRNGTTRGYPGDPNGSMTEGGDLKLGDSIASGVLTAGAGSTNAMRGDKIESGIIVAP